MAALDIIDQNNKKVASVDLAETLLSDKINKSVLYDAVKVNQAGKHHGTVKTKNRSEVSYTNKKIYRQKGTGNARHSSRKSAPFVGGGRVFGPKPRSYTLGMNKKVRVLAIKEAIRARLQQEKVKIVDDLGFSEIKTKHAAEMFKKLGVENALILTKDANEIVQKSVRNLKGFLVLSLNQINVYDILKYDNLIFSKDAFEEIKERYLA